MEMASSQTRLQAMAQVAVEVAKASLLAGGEIESTSEHTRTTHSIP